MESTRMLKTAALPAAFLVLAATWVAFAAVPELASFGVGRYMTGGAAAAYALAATIVGYLNSWWGFALAVAAAAAFGLSWTVIIIKGVLQKAGTKFAIQYASML
jgi:hypothetical protein